MKQVTWEVFYWCLPLSLWQRSLGQKSLVQKSLGQKSLQRKSLGQRLLELKKNLLYVFNKSHLDKSRLYKSHLDTNHLYKSHFDKGHIDKNHLNKSLGQRSLVEKSLEQKFEPLSQKSLWQILNLYHFDMYRIKAKNINGIDANIGFCFKNWLKQTWHVWFYQIRNTRKKS